MSETLERRDRRKLFFLVLALAALAAAALLAASHAGEAWARAGGGHDFGGGGDSGGGGGGIDIILGLLIWLAIEHPVIGIPLLIIAVVGFILFGRKAKDVHTTTTIRRAGTMVQRQDRAAQLQALEDIRRRDPGFADQAFLARAAQAFVQIQQAWSGQDLTRVRAFISDGVRERFELQFEIQKSRGIRNRLQDVRILGFDIAAASCDRHFDTIHVRFQAQMKDEDVDLETGKVARLNTGDPFTEYWTFLRRPGAKTLQKGGLVEGVCPNCGADLQISDAGQCGYCHAVVASGEFDWVLTEITQASVWSGAPPGDVPGLAQMNEVDPAFNIAHIEDRTSVIFWRLMRSFFAGDDRFLGNVALPQFAEGIKATLAPGQDGWRRFFHEAAVGAIDVMAVTPGGWAAGEEGRAPMDRIDVSVTWSAVDSWRNAEGAVRSGGEKAVRMESYVLVRLAGVKTQQKSGFKAAPCPGCGAPDDGKSSKGGCPFCGAPQNDGSRDWVLAAVGSAPPSSVGAVRAEPLRRPAQARADLVLAGMAAAMFSDGVVDEKEERMLGQFARSRGMPEGQVREIVAAVRAGVPLPRPSSPQEAREFLEAMVQMALVDGNVAKEEENMLVVFGTPLGYSKIDVQQMIASQRAQLYRQARTALKQRA